MSLTNKKPKMTPAVRVVGYTDDWEQRKLSDLTERVIRKNKNNESSRPLTISAQDGLIDQNDFFDKQIASRDVSGYFLVKNGEFAYNKSYSNGYPWGAIKRLDKYDMGVLSTLYIIFRPTNIFSQFLVSYYDTTKWYKEVAKHAAEGARNHGLLNIAPTDFFSTVLVIPNSIEEQQKIGTFFKQLDDTIALHQRKLSGLQQARHWAEQNLLPEPNETTPKVRVGEFDDEWKRVPIGGVASRVRGNDGRMDLPTLTISATNGWMNQQDRFSGNIAGKEQKNYTLLKRGQLSYNHGNSKAATYGVVFALKDLEEALVPRVYHSFEVNTGMDASYLECLFATRKPDQQLRKFVSSSARMDGLLNITYDSFAKVLIPVPSLVEQQVIAKVFTTIDARIKSEQQLIADLQAVKRWALDNMFV